MYKIKSDVRDIQIIEYLNSVVKAKNENRCSRTYKFLQFFTIQFDFIH